MQNSGQGMYTISVDPGHRRVAAKQSSIHSGSEFFTLRRITYGLRFGRLSVVWFLRNMALSPIGMQQVHGMIGGHSRFIRTGVRSPLVTSSLSLPAWWKAQDADRSRACRRAQLGCQD